MNVYLIGVIISMIVYLVVGNLAGKAVKDLDDYYVSGRNAPTVLIVGTLVASFLSTGVFMGDTGECYAGYFIPIVIVGIMQACGYVYGSLYFGRYIRRSEVRTVPEYFGKRFNSRKVQVLCGITTVVGVTGYLLSVTQGTTLLMSELTGLDYSICLIIAWLSYSIFTMYSGSKGVIITDTIMFFVFLSAAIIAVPYIIKAAGGWVPAIKGLAIFDQKPGIISYHGMLGSRFKTPFESIVWSISYGVVWAMVVASSPWQTSRYLMAKDEHTVMRSSAIACLCIIGINTALYFAASMINLVNPTITPVDKNFIWAGMNLVPTWVGVLLLTGIMAAGLSSASTFLSLIGFSLTNDIIQFDEDVSDKKMLKYSRILMLICSLIALVISYFQPPAVFFFMYFAGTVLASSWGLIAFMSVWSKKITKTGAFWGILLGFLGNFVAKLVTEIKGVSLPIFLDPFYIGLYLSLAGVIIGSSLTEVTDEEKAYREKLHEVPEAELDKGKMDKTYNHYKLLVTAGVIVLVVLIGFYAVPYGRAISGM